MTFTERVAAELEARGLEPINLASELSLRGQRISVAAICSWMRGETEPRLSTAIVTSKVLEFSLDEIEPKREAALASNGQ
ncbi:MAG: hypothetical protein IT364_12925 [Candidatus Hydrogenedentes bacterium]|nr:hypothetical protein [Candidatus Hydrogenedentota bacterium]